MTDHEIVSLFLQRDETAIAQAQLRYGTYCRSIAVHILDHEADAAECVNDVWLAAWNSIPPKRPERLSAYLGKLTRNIAIDRLRTDRAAKRCTGEYAMSLDELAELVPDGSSVEDQVQSAELADAVRTFVRGLPEAQRRVFICRYWYIDSLQEIGERFGFSESKVKSMLHRLREKLKKHLEKEKLL